MRKLPALLQRAESDSGMTCHLRSRMLILDGTRVQSSALDCSRPGPSVFWFSVGLLLGAAAMARKAPRTRRRCFA